MKLRILFLAILFSFLPIHAQEQDTIVQKREIQYDQSEDLIPVEFDRNFEKQLKENKDFDYMNQQNAENWWTRFKKWLNAKYNQLINWLFGNYEAGSVLAFLIPIIPYILLIILLILIAWLFSRLNPGRVFLKQEKQAQVFMNEEEELVKNEDLPALIKEAIQNGNFRIAIRYYYLLQLRKLDELKLIEYQFQKTNREYSEEISDDQIRKVFGETTRFYEFIWYGAFPVTHSEFNLAQNEFQKLNKMLEGK